MYIFFVFMCFFISRQLTHFETTKKYIYINAMTKNTAYYFSFYVIFSFIVYGVLTFFNPYCSMIKSDFYMQRVLYHAETLGVK